MQKSNVRVFRDLEALSQAAADTFVRLAYTSIRESGGFTVALTGGSTVVRLYELLSSQPYLNQVEWDKVRFFWGDERLVPPDHPESNYRTAKRLLLDPVGVKAANIFRICGELSAQDSIQDYKNQLKEQAAAGLGWPQFDIVLLGMGSDGHIASIFPGEISKQERSLPVVATKADYLDRPGERVTLTPMVFNSAKHVFFLVAGESKAPALGKVLGGDGDPEEFPALRIEPESGGITWFIDEDAASQLPKQSFDHGEK